MEKAADWAGAGCGLEGPRGWGWRCGWRCDRGLDLSLGLCWCRAGAWSMAGFWAEAKVGAWLGLGSGAGSNMGVLLLVWLMAGNRAWKW